MAITRLPHLLARRVCTVCTTNTNTLKSVFYQRTQEQVPYSLKHLICMHQVTLSESSKFKRRHSSEAHIAHVCGGVCPRWEERIESVLSSDDDRILRKIVFAHHTHLQVKICLSPDSHNQHRKFKFTHLFVFLTPQVL